MGINGLLPFLKTIGFIPKVVQLEAFRGKTIAFDIYSELYAYYKTAAKIECQRSISNSGYLPSDYAVYVAFLSAFSAFVKRYSVSYEIEMIFVLDGDQVDEKAETQKKRSETKAKYTSELSELVEIRDSEEGDRYFPKEGADVKRICDIFSYSKFLAPTEMKEFISYLKEQGHLVLVAKNEGEQLASELCNQQYAYAVFTRDTDNLLYYPNMWIRPCMDLTYKKNKDVVEVIIVEEMLAALELTHEKFVDLCIMAGCDYNKRPYGYTPPKIHSDLKKYTMKEVIARGARDYSSANYEICINRFSPMQCEELIHSSTYEGDMTSDRLHAYVDRTSENL